MDTILHRVGRHLLKQFSACNVMYAMSFNGYVLANARACQELKLIKIAPWVKPEEIIKEKTAKLRLTSVSFNNADGAPYILCFPVFSDSVALLTKYPVMQRLLNLVLDSACGTYMDSQRKWYICLLSVWYSPHCNICLFWNNRMNIVTGPLCWVQEAARKRSRVQGRWKWSDNLCWAKYVPVYCVTLK